MKRSTRFLLAMLLCAPLAAAGAACGGDDDDDGDDDDSSSTYTCCLNGSFYSCPDQSAFDQCSSMGPSACNRDSSRDDECT